MDSSPKLTNVRSSWSFTIIWFGGRAILEHEYINKLEELEDGTFIRQDVDQVYRSNKRSEVTVGRSRAPVDRDLEVNTTRVDWRVTIAGRLVPASEELVRQRFDFMECGGRRGFLLTTDSSISQRYVLPDSFLARTEVRVS